MQLLNGVKAVAESTFSYAADDSGGGVKRFPHPQPERTSVRSFFQLDVANVACTARLAVSFPRPIVLPLVLTLTHQRGHRFGRLSCYESYDDELGLYLPFRLVGWMGCTKSSSS